MPNRRTGTGERETRQRQDTNDNGSAAAGRVCRGRRASCRLRMHRDRHAPAAYSDTAPATGQGQARQAGPSPVAAATLRAIAAAEVGTTITPVTDPNAMQADVPHLARSEARAIHAALGAWPRSKIMGITLAWVTMSGPGFNERPRLVWLVSVDPYGGAFVEGTPACGTYDYIVDFIGPATGRMLVGTAASKVTGLRPLPVIGPTPSIASSNSCPPGPL